MKIYHSCEYCRQIYSISDVEGPEGAVELNGICEECAEELGMTESPIINNHHFYN